MKKLTILALVLLCAGLALSACAPRHHNGGRGYTSGPAYHPAPRQEPKRFDGGPAQQRPTPRADMGGPGQQGPRPR